MSGLHGDQIVYVYVTNGHGIDGRDPTDRGGKIVKASFTPLNPDAGPFCRYEKRVVNVDDVRRAAIGKLDALDRLLLVLDNE